MKKWALLLLSLFISVSFAADDAKPEKLTVILDWFPNPDHAPLIIAQHQGYFKEEGLEVELIGPADPADPPKLVAAGKADIGITYQPELMEYIDQGLPLIRIGTLIDKPLDCVAALQSSGIKTLTDLKGKRIGAGGDGLSSIMLKVILTKAGLTEKDVEIINVRYNLTQALLSRKVDAITGVMRNVEIPQLELKGQKVVTFFPEDHGIPNYSVLVFVANIANKNDDRFPRFLNAVKKAVRHIDEKPEQSWQEFVNRYPEANNPVNREAWFATMPYFAEDPAGLNSKEWQRFAQFMQQNNMIKKIQPMSRYAIVLR